jgi:hypothetical protein
MYSMRSSLFGMATTLRAGRLDDLVPVLAKVSFIFQNCMTASGAQTTYCKRSVEAHPELRWLGA